MTYPMSLRRFTFVFNYPIIRLAKFIPWRLSNVPTPVPVRNDDVRRPAHHNVQTCPPSSHDGDDSSVFSKQQNKIKTFHSSHEGALSTIRRHFKLLYYLAATILDHVSKATTRYVSQLHNSVGQRLSMPYNSVDQRLSVPYNCVGQRSTVPYTSVGQRSKVNCAL